MAESGAPGAIRENEYEALLGALTETDRGRWFLDEYIRRNQKPETQVVLDAIARLEKTMTRERTVPSIDRIRLDIADMQEAIERTKREIANIKHESDDGNRFIEASNELDAIVTKTEAATQEILAAAEAIQEHAWTMREAGADETACDEIDARATEIFMACSFQDLTGQRTQKIVNVLQYLESRINMMISIWGIQDATADEGAYIEDSRPDAHLLNGPQLDGRGVSQCAVDEMFGSSASAGDEAETASEEDIDALFAAAPAQETPAPQDAAPSLAETQTQAEAEAAAALSEMTDQEAAEAAALDAGEIDIDALFAAESGTPEDASGDGAEAGDPFDDLVMVEAEDAAGVETDEDVATTEDGEIDFDSIDFDAIDTDDAAPEKDEPSATTDLASHRDRAQDLDEDDAGEDPLEQLSPGERQSLFS
ncbi:MAG: chemotaxis protein [Stappia sp.]|uniref:protein phosphatase CheZ n=1 Tax=Stappia sp. TaxID=1870903 RepID=UPI000C4EC10B|nr:protein phosphatase CheZ [Stappia sp.]MAA97496.1 chemotaxis protein [Stappia sp.]MBM22029.1 chemotaxis protein [Stappia sp.]